MIATDAGWIRLKIDSGDFLLTAFVPPKLTNTTQLTIYIEGDGLAWSNTSTPSTDPTPLNPLGLKLALADPSAAIYLARPCQFVLSEDKRGCSPKYWTSHRFSTEVIAATSAAVEQLKQRYSAEHLIMVGYSGGGAVASLVTAQRNDINRLITVAGNLDHNAWTAEHGLWSLSGSLNPADVWQQLQSVSQTHFVGGQDKVISASVARSYAARFPANTPLSIHILSAFDHYCCWAEQWPQLLKDAVH